VGYLSVYAGGGQTNNIYEPIFYYVLPEWFSVYDFSTDYTKLPDFVPNTNNGVIGTPKLSVFTVPTEISGLSRQVVKIDYSGTGYNFLAGQPANNQIHLNTLPDGTNGTYQGMIYIVSPTTKLTNTAYNPNNTSNFAPSGITFIQIGYRETLLTCTISERMVLPLIKSVVLILLVLLKVIKMIYWLILDFLTSIVLIRWNMRFV